MITGRDVQKQLRENPLNARQTWSHRIFNTQSGGTGVAKLMSFGSEGIQVPPRLWDSVRITSLSLHDCGEGQSKTLQVPGERARGSFSSRFRATHFYHFKRFHGSKKLDRGKKGN